MLALNLTFFIQIANFLCAWALFDYLLLRPLFMQVQKEHTLEKHLFTLHQQSLKTYDESVLAYNQMQQNDAHALLVAMPKGRKKSIQLQASQPDSQEMSMPESEKKKLVEAYQSLIVEKVLGNG